MKKILLLILFGFFLVFTIPSVNAWCGGNTSFTRRRNVTISSSGYSTRQNYAVLFDVNYDADMEADFTDIRFFNGSDVVDFWIELIVPSDRARVWLEVPYIQPDTNITIQMCYGAGDSVSSSSGWEVFTFFDDFDDDSFNTTLWGDRSGTQTEVGGYVTQEADGNNWFSTGSDTQQNVSVRARLNFSGTPNQEYGYYHYHGSPYYRVTHAWGTDKVEAENSGAGDCEQTYRYGQRMVTAQVWEITRIDASTVSYAKYNGTYDDTNYTEWLDGGCVCGSCNIPVTFQKNSNGNAQSVDWVLLRNAYEPEPLASVLNEETYSVAEPTGIDLFLNDTEGNITITFGQVVNITARINVSGVFVELYQDGTLFNNDTTISHNMTEESWFTNTTYTILANFPGNDSYSASSSTWYIIVLKQTTTLNLTFNGTEGNQTFIYPNVTNATGYTSATGTSGVSLFRDNSSVSNSDLIQLGAGTYNYTASFSHANYSADPKTLWLTISPAGSGLSLTSSGGWSMSEGQTTTLTCTANTGLTIDLVVAGVHVASPYGLQVQTGTYAVSCTISEIGNYTPSTDSNTIVVNPLVSCTSASTFGYNITITTTTNMTTLNFTTLVSQHYVRSNLGDVNISGVSNVWKNTTDGYYVVVNNTVVNSFVVYFGNYMANASYNDHEINTSEIQNVTGYNQQYPVVLYNVLDELTGEELYPPNTTLMSIIHCSMGENYIPVDTGETNFILASLVYVDKASLRISYTADMYYSRQLYLTDSDFTVLNFYVIDAYENALDRIDFIMLDVNYYDSQFEIYKPIEDTSIIITEGYFDASHYFSAYLMEDSDYYLRTIDADGTITSFGRITVVAPAEKRLGRTYYSLNPQAVLIADNILMNAYTNDARTILYIEYEDDLNQTEELTISVFFENGTLFNNETYNNIDSVDTNHDISAYSNDSFTVTFNVTHTTLGNSPVVYTMSLLTPFEWGIQGVGSMVYNLFSLALLLMVGGITTRRSLIPGAILLTVTFLLVWGMGWLTGIDTTAQIFVFTIVLLLLAIINYIKQGGE